MSNKGASYRFRSDVRLFLLAKGLDARAARELKVSERLRGAHPGHILGMEPWVITTHSRQEIDLSTDMNALKSDAFLAKSEWYATVNRRKSHDVDDAYVTMPLFVFARILKGELPTQQPGIQDA